MAALEEGPSATLKHWLEIKSTLPQEYRRNRDITASYCLRTQPFQPGSMRSAPAFDSRAKSTADPPETCSVSACNSVQWPAASMANLAVAAIYYL